MEACIRIQKMGNGLEISIPSLIANEFFLSDGVYMNLQDGDNKAIIETVKLNISYNLADMLNEITENNIHHPIDTGMQTGNEIW
jgi:antitoxin component of MazEF toxin-antitoxin module